MNRHFKITPEDGLLKPEQLGLRYASMQKIQVSEPVTIASGDEELCIAVVSGSVQFEADGVGGTANTFDMLYVPRDSSIRFAGDACLLRYGAPATVKTQFVHLPFADVDKDPEKHFVYGKAELGSKRDVWNFITKKEASSRFLTGMCFGSPSGWTAWPPHAHGEKREEIYYYLDMDDTFAIQCLYGCDGEKDEAFIVKEGDVVVIREGFHPNLGNPKCGIRYIFCMVSVQENDREFMDLRIDSKYGDRLE